MSPSTTARALASTPPSPSQSTAAERKSVAEGPPKSGTINRTGLHRLEGFTLHTYYLECLASVVSLL